MAVNDSIFDSCNISLDRIASSECIGSSLTKITGNFTTVEDTLNEWCESLNNFASSVSLSVTPVGGIMIYKIPSGGTIYNQTADTTIPAANASTITTAINANKVLLVSETGSGAVWQVCNGTGNTPDLRGLFVVGAGTGDSTAHQYNATGGSATHTLTVDQIPSHSHTYSDTYGGGSTRSANSRYGSGEISGLANGVPTVNTSSVGGGTSHPNEPQYMSLLYIQRIQ